MKVGDLVRMKHAYLLATKYTEVPLIVYEMTHNAVKVLFPDGRVKCDLTEYYEVINDRR
mgnify:CR=1 FL=1